MKKSIYLLLAISLNMASCAGDGKENELLLVEVNGEKVEVSGDVADSYVLYADTSDIYFRHSRTSPLLSRFHIAEDSIIIDKSFIRAGNAGNEIQSLMVNSISADAQKFVFYDPNMRKTVTFDTKTDSVLCSQSDICKYDGLLISRFAMGHPRGTMIINVRGDDNISDGIVSLVTNGGEEFLSLKGIGKESMRDIPFNTCIHYAPNSKIYVQPGGERCLFVSSTGQYAEVFEIDGDRAVNKKVLVDDVPSFSIGEMGRIEAADDDLKFGFDVSTTEDRIYLSPYRDNYSDRKAGLKDNPKFVGTANGYEFCDEVWEYDWDGNSIARYKLTPGISSFWVSPDRVMWATSEDDDSNTIIMRYDLP